MATADESAGARATELNGTRPVGRSISLLLLLPLLIATVWCAGQLGLQLFFPSVPPIQPARTADYGQWTYETFNAINPQLVTLIAREQGTDAPVIQVAALASFTATLTPSDVPSATATSTHQSPSPTATFSPTLSPSATDTLTVSPTSTPSPSDTPSRTPSPTATSSPTRTASPTRTRTLSPTRTPTNSSTPSRTSTRTPSPTATRTYTVTASRTRTPSPTYTRTFSVTPTRTPSATRTLVPTNTPTRSVTPVPPLQAQFAAVPIFGIAPLTVSFTDQSSGDIASYFWTFGTNQGFSTAQNPVHTFNSPGFYTVRLMVFGIAGNYDTTTGLIFVFPRPTPTFTPTPTNTQRSTVAPTNTVASSTPTPTNTLPPFPTNTPSQPTVIPPSSTPTFTNTQTRASTLTYTPAPTFTATATPITADLSVELVLSNATPAEGATISYTVMVRNNGTGMASAVQVAFPLPSEVTFVLALPDQGTYSSSAGQWTVGALAPGGMANLTLYATVNGGTAGTPVLAQAAVTDLVVADPQPANNSASVGFTSTVPASNADVSLAMNVSSAAPFVGNVLTYTLTVANAGPNTATNIEALDLLPAGLTFQSSTGVGSYDDATGIWNVGTLVPGGTATLNIRAVVNNGTEGTSIVNSAGITSLAQADPDGSNNSASAPINVQSRGVQLTKTVDDATAIVNQEIVFTISVTNLMSINATGVQARDVLPGEFTLISAAPTQGTFSGDEWDVGVIGPGATAQLQLRACVEPAAAGQTIQNTAAVIALDQPDFNLGNNRASVNVGVATTDLAITKRVNRAAPAEQSTITYTIDVFNNATADYSGVLVNDSLPNTLSFVSSVATLGSYDETAGVWDIGLIPAGGTARLTISARVEAPAGTVITNTAQIVASDQPDSNPLNDIASASLTVAWGDLAITKTVNDPTPIVDQTITYTVRVANNMQIAVTNIEVEDVLPSELTFASSPYTVTHGAYDTTTGIWLIPALSSNTTAVLTIRAVVTNAASGSTITNTASILSSDPVDANPANDTASVNIVVPVSDADLVVTKTVTDTTPGEGQLVTYVVRVRNAGPSRATNVEVMDVLPSGITVISLVPSLGSYDQATGIWNVGTLSSGVSHTLTITAVINSGTIGTTIANTAFVSNLTQTDPNPANDSATVEMYVPGADLSLTKVVDVAAPYEGTHITYTLTVTNNGPDDTTNVQVTDVLPIGVQYVSDDSGGQYDPDGGIWSVGNLLNGGAATLNIVAQVANGTVGGTINNGAFISRFALPDLNDANNSDNAVINVAPRPDVDLGLTMSVDNTTPVVGESVNYTITLINNSVTTATNVQITDVLPAGLVLVSGVPSSGSFDGQTWTIGVLAGNSSAALALTASVDAAPGSVIANSAQITASDFNDSNGSNDSASLNVTVGVNLSVVSLCSADPAVTREWRVSNLNGRSIDFVWAIDGSGQSGMATIPAASGVSGEYLLTTSTGAGVNTLIITVGGVEHSRLDSAAIPCETDLSLTNVVSNPAPVEGETVTFTVTLLNAGSYAANGIQLQSTLSAGLVFVGAVPDVGVYDSGAHIWSVNSLSAGQTASLSISAQIGTLTAGSTLMNSLSIVAVDRGDPDASNNAAASSVTVQSSPVDLVISAGVDNDNPAAGDTVTFSLTLTNQGVAAVGGVQVTNLLDVGLGLTVSSVVVSQGVFAGNVWDVGSLQNGGSVTLSLSALVEAGSAGATLNYAASVIAAAQPDPDSGSNAVTVPVIVQSADLAVTVSADSVDVAQNAQVVLTVGVANLGPNDASNVVLDVPLPAGFTYVGDDGGGAYDVVAGQWAVADLVSGAGVTLHLTVLATAPPPATIGFSASVQSSLPGDTNSANDGASLSVDVIPPPVASFSVEPVSGEEPLTVAVVDASSGDITSYMWDFGDGSGAVSGADPGTHVYVSPNTYTVTLTVSGPGGSSSTTQSVTVVLRSTDVGVDVVVDDTMPVSDSAVVYTLSVTNYGSRDTTGVQTALTIPVELVVVGSTPSQGSFDGSTWIVDGLGVGATATLVLNVHVGNVVAGTPLNLSAALALPNHVDTNGDNNSDTETITIAGSG